MNLKTFLEQGPLNLRDVYFSASDGTGYFSSYALRPDDFLTFAKADLYTADTRGLINGLSNAKRAIDCQADSFIECLGFRTDRLDKQLGPDGVKSLAFGMTSSEGPLKFRFLQALGIATPSIVGRMRALRNMLEHEYKKPARRGVTDAIGIAELFVQACAGKMVSMFDGAGLGSGITTARGHKEVAKEFYIRYVRGPRPKFEIFFWNHERTDKAKPPEHHVPLGHADFVPLLKLICRANWHRDMTESVKDFLTELGFQLPRRFRVRDGEDL